MKKIFIGILIIIATFFLTSKSALAYVRVRSYTRSNGKYVSPYYRSNSNSYRWDNYSSRGNINPWTGKKGYKSWW